MDASQPLIPMLSTGVLQLHNFSGELDGRKAVGREGRKRPLAISVVEPMVEAVVA